MKLFSFLTLFIFSIFCFGQNPNQEILLKAGTFTPKNEIVLEDFSSNNPSIFDGKYYRFMLFSVLPSTKQKEKIEEVGIHLLEYIPNNTFIISISKNISKKKLQDFNVIALLPIQSKQKIHPKLQNGNCPNWAKEGNNAIIEVLFYKDVKPNLAFETLKAKNYAIKEINSFAHSIILSLPISELEKIAESPFIHFIAPIDPPSYPENKTGRPNSEEFEQQVLVVLNNATNNTGKKGSMLLDKDKRLHLSLPVP